jgi:ribosome biogenesis ATPase
MADGGRRPAEDEAEDDEDEEDDDGGDAQAPGAGAGAGAGAEGAAPAAAMDKDEAKRHSLHAGEVAAAALKTAVVPLTPAQMAPLFVSASDFLAAVPKVQPSAQREGFATVPDVSFDDIGALSDIRLELEQTILQPLRHPERFEQVGEERHSNCYVR